MIGTNPRAITYYCLILLFLSIDYFAPGGEHAPISSSLPPSISLANFAFIIGDCVVDAIKARHRRMAEGSKTGSRASEESKKTI